MINITTIKCTIRHADGRVDELAVDSERVLIGSGSHCEVRLPREVAHVEALMVEERSGGLFAEARSLDPPPLVNGIPFTAGRLLPESTVAIGSIELNVELIQTTAQGGGKQKKRESQRSPALMVLAALLFVAAVYMLLNAPKKEAFIGKPPPAPALWSKREPAESCPQTVAASAQALASDLQASAEGKRERAPFYFQDGVAAVALFKRAAACHEAGGDPAAALQSREAGSRLQKNIEDEFHIHQVRLGHALAVEDWSSAQTEVYLLRSVLEGRRSEYASWLQSLERKIELRFSGKKSKGRAKS